VTFAASVKSFCPGGTRSGQRNRLEAYSTHSTAVARSGQDIAFRSVERCLEPDLALSPRTERDPVTGRKVA
jgi:hypothetical protein